jgi:hypothetical protein
VFEQDVLQTVASKDHPPTVFKLVLFELWYRHWVEQIPVEDVVAVERGS